jgi:hypothetical protein
MWLLVAFLAWEADCILLPPPLARENADWRHQHIPLSRFKKKVLSAQVDQSFARIFEAAEIGQP